MNASPNPPPAHLTVIEALPSYPGADQPKLCKSISWDRAYPYDKALRVRPLAPILSPTARCPTVPLQAARECDG